MGRENSRTVFYWPDMALKVFGVALRISSSGLKVRSTPQPATRTPLLPGRMVGNIIRPCVELSCWFSQARDPRGIFAKFAVLLRDKFPWRSRAATR